MKVVNPFELIYGKGLDADINSLKSKMLIVITQHLRENYGSRSEMANAIGCSKSQLSAIMNSKLGTLSFEKLSSYLYKLGVSIKCELQNDNDALAIHIDIQ